MDGRKVVKILLVEHEMTIADLARKMGKSPQTLRNTLSGNSFTVSNLESILSVLGAELVVLGKDGKIYR